MRNLFSTRIKVIIVVAVLLAAALTVLSNVTGQTIPDMVMQAAMAPFRAAGNALTKQAEQYYSYMFRYEALAAENEALKEQIAQMEDQARKADAVTRENERLRKHLNLKSTHEDYDTVDANIISWSSTDWTNYVTISRGSNAGIEEDMCAITATGQVVGLVTDVGPNYAVVKTVLDSSLEISANIAASGYNGMVQGGYATGEEGYLRMNYLPSDAVICNHDQVVTAGSTLYPRDLVLGSVIDAGFDETGVAKFAILEPAADFGSLEQIFVLTSYGVE